MSGVQKLKSKASGKAESKVEVEEAASAKRRKLAEKRKVKEEAYKKRIQKEMKRTLREGKRKPSGLGPLKKGSPKRSPIILPKGHPRKSAGETKSVDRAKGFKMAVKPGEVMIPSTRFPDNRPITIPGIPSTKPTRSWAPRVLVSAGEGLGNIIMTTPFIDALVSGGYRVDLIVFPIPKDMEFKSLFDNYSTKVNFIINGYDEEECERIKSIPYDYTFLTKWGTKGDRRLPWFKNVKEVSYPRGTRQLWSIEETELNFKLYEEYIDKDWRNKIRHIAFVNNESESFFDISPGAVGMHLGCKVEGIDWRKWKQWPYFHLLAKKFKNPILFGTEKDYENYMDWVPGAKWSKNTKSLLGETPTVAELAAAISKCSIFISNDSGVAHVAAATGVPTFILVGGTSEIKLQHSSIRTLSQKQPCQPCHMSPSCPEYQGKCLWDLYPKDVVKAVKNDIEVRYFYNELVNRPKVGTGLISKIQKKVEPKISIVIGVRNRDPVSLRNLLISLRNQSYKGEIETSLVDGGSSLPYRSRYKIMARNFNIQYKYLPLLYWNKPLVLNYGIRNSSAESKYIFCADADMIVPPTVIETIVKAFREKPNTQTFVAVRTRKFRDGTTLAGKINDWDLLKPLDDVADPETFSKFVEESYLTGFGASGGLQAASRKWFFDVRGYDEDLFLWGAPDTDMHRRALFHDKLRCIYFTPINDHEAKVWDAHPQWPKAEVRVDKNMFLIHQWHCFRDIRLHAFPFVQSTWNYNRDIYRGRIKKKIFKRNRAAYWGRLEGREIIVKEGHKDPHLEWQYEK